MWLGISADFGFQNEIQKIGGLRVLGDHFIYMFKYIYETSIRGVVFVNQLFIIIFLLLLIDFDFDFVFVLMS